MAYGKDFSRDDYMYSQFSVLDDFHAGAETEPYTDQSLINTAEVVKRVILPTPNANTVLRHLDKFRLLAYDLKSDEYARPGEKRITDILSQQDLDKHAIQGWIPIAWCLTKPFHEDGWSYSAIFMIDTVMQKHNFAELLLDRLGDIDPCSEGFFPHNPMTSAYEYWKHQSKIRYIYPARYEDKEEKFQFMSQKLKWSPGFINYLCDESEGTQSDNDIDSDNDEYDVESTTRDDDSIRRQDTSSFPVDKSYDLIRLGEKHRSTNWELNVQEEEATRLHFLDYVESCSLTHRYEHKSGTTQFGYLRPLSIQRLTTDSGTEAYRLRFARVPDPKNRTSEMGLLSHGRNSQFRNFTPVLKQRSRTWEVSTREGLDAEYMYESQELVVEIHTPRSVLNASPRTTYVPR